MHGVRFLKAGVALACLTTPSFGQNVSQYHADALRTGVYKAAGLTYAAAAAIQATAGYTAANLSGDVYAQPLYWTPASGDPQVVVATMQNNIYALDAISGLIVWQRNLGSPFTGLNSPCVPDKSRGSNPQGVYGTPVIDQNGILYLDVALQTSDSGVQHEIYALNLNSSGATVAGWPVDPGAKISGFKDEFEAQHAAALVENGTVYMSYGALKADCKAYRGWVVGVDTANPTKVSAFASSTAFKDADNKTAVGGGIWGPGGALSDGQNIYVASGNAKRTDGVFSGGETVFRLGLNLSFSGSTNDYFAPTIMHISTRMTLTLGRAAPPSCR